MKRYYNQHGCHNCAWVFIRKEYEEQNEYYCNNHDAGVRPSCLSIKLNEMPCYPTTNKERNKKWKEYENKWNEWASKHKVNSWGICIQWKWNYEK